MGRYLLLLACFALAGGLPGARGRCAAKAVEAKKAAPTTQGVLELVDLDGVTRRPLDAAGERGAIVIFIASECPISNSYAPEIHRICEEYGKDGADGFRVSLAYPDRDLTAAEAKKHVKEFGYTCPVLLDTHRELAKRLEAKVTPEAFVIDPAGRVLYRGRIDDKYVTYGKARPEPTTRDLRNALDAIRKGAAVPVSKTDAVGCPIEG